MDVSALRATASAISQELAGDLGTHIDLQQGRLNDLPSHWSGSAAADNATQLAQRISGQVGAEHDNLSSIAQVISTAADQLEGVVRTKADAVRTDFSTDVVASKTSEQVDRLIAYARGNFDGCAYLDGQREKVREILPEIGDGDDPGDYAARWLDNVFLPAVEGRVAAFNALSEATHTAVTRLYGQLAEALESLGHPAYTSPGGYPSATTDLDATQAPTPVHQALFSTPSAPSKLANTVTSGAAANTSTAAMPQPPAVTPAAGTTSDRADTVAHASPIAAASPSMNASTASSPPGSKTDQDGGQAKKTDSDDGTSDKDAKGKNGKDKDSKSKDGKDKEKTADTPAITDMGKAGEWRPGDIANVLTAASRITGTVPDLLEQIGSPLKAVGETVKDFGEAFKDVVGSDGITGLVKEGVDAAEHVDKLIEHHTQPAASSNAHPAEAGTSAQAAQPGPPPLSGDAPTSAAHDTPPTGTVKATGQDTNAPQPHIPPALGNPAPAPVGAPTTTPASVGASGMSTPGAAAAMPAGGIFGTPTTSGRAEKDAEHRPKNYYLPADIKEETTEPEPEAPEVKAEK
ncbi:hypothetical protein ACWDXV_16475 [Nocardia nova]